MEERRLASRSKRIEHAHLPGANQSRRIRALRIDWEDGFSGRDSSRQMELQTRHDRTEQGARSAGMSGVAMI